MKEHHRYVQLDDYRFADLPPFVESQCYLIDRQRFKTHNNYLAAREYYRFRHTKENFYVHGGLTPEEVVVPFARFSRALSKPEPPIVRLLTNEFRYAVPSHVRIEIRNRNNSPIEVFSVRLVDAVGDEVTIDVIPAKKLAQAQIMTKFQRKVGGSNTRTLTIRVDYVYQGRTYGPEDHTFPITMKSIMEVEDDGIDF